MTRRNLTFRDHALAATIVLGGVACNALFMGRATALLSLALVLAWIVWAREGWRSARAGLVRVYLAGVVIQSLHFSEEYLTGFQRAFPGLFGYAWSDERFAAFNVAWLVVFTLAAIGIALGEPVAYVIVLFFALGGGVGNGLGHLALGVLRRGYFPGLLTAPLSLASGVLILVTMFGGVEARQT